MRFAPGQNLGPYEIVALLGAGGMGEVYRAGDPRLGRDVAIKVLPKHFANDREYLDRFEQEARAAAALNHPNILAVLRYRPARRRAVHCLGTPRRADTSRPAPGNQSRLAAAAGAALRRAFWHQYDVTPDGDRFLINARVDGLTGPLTVVLDWPLSLKR